MTPRMLVQLVVFQCIVACVLGCQSQMCRRKRHVERDRRSVRMQNVKGCFEGVPPSWSRQMAYCLNLQEIKMILVVRDWYWSVYRSCDNRGCKDGNRNIDQCVKCWKKRVKDDEIAQNFTGVTTEQILNCINGSIYAYLNDSQPILETLSRHKYEITLPETRPENFWWSVTVDLPCKPRHFVFFNAYCINSFGINMSEGDYVLTQNNLLHTDSGILFFVDFTEECTFSAKDIRIRWNESTPTPGLPQVAPMRTNFERVRRAPLKIHYEADKAARLSRVDEGTYSQDEYETNSKRAKRQIKDTGLSQLGLEFPCTIESLQKPDRIQNGEAPYHIVGPVRNRYLIKKWRKTSGLELNLNFGNHGCFFGAAEVKTVPNPPSNWLYQQRTDERGIACMTCQNSHSDSDCTKNGVKTICSEDEVCQTEVRHITKQQKLITKSCKHEEVCRRNSMRETKHSECRPGKPGSFCLCCCNSDMCNDNDDPCSL